MQKKYKILMGTNEQGGAECLAPVAKFLLSEGHDVFLYSGSPCAPIFTRENLSYEIVQNSAPPLEDLVALIKRLQPDVVVTGIIGKKNNLDFTLMAAAKRQNIPVLSILDSWLQYRERLFDHRHPSDVYWPHRLAVMDESCVTDLKNIGFPEDRVVVTGHPKFDELFRLKELRVNVKKRSELRLKYNLRTDKPVLVFFSQPLSKYYAKAEMGYDEFDVLKILLASYEDINREFKVELVIKEHPLRKTFSQNSQILPEAIKCLGVADADDLVILADVVLGMSTTILVHAALLGIPVVSIQPNVKRDFNLLTRMHWYQNVENKDDLTQNLLTILRDRNDIQPQMSLRLDGRVCERIVDVISKMIETRVS